MFDSTDILFMKQALSAVLLTLCVGLSAGDAAAQYDRDGRYVPSPNGIPQDPTRSTVPGYSGTPGGTLGTPNLPRSMNPPVPSVAPLKKPERYEVPLGQRVIRLTLEQCDDGWSKQLRVTPTEFRRRCAAIRRAREMN